MRQLIVVALVLGALCLSAAASAQWVKAFKGGGGPTGFSTAARTIEPSWVKAY